MLVCEVCGLTRFRQEFVDEVFNVDGRLVLVEQIPAQVCMTCGEATFSRETTERVRRMVHGEKMPIRSVELPVYEFA